MSTTRLVAIVPSTRQYKKFMATFLYNNGKQHRTVHFGDNRYEDYTIHKDKQRRQSYRSRHANDNLGDPMSPGALSWYVLWGDSTSITSNIKQYRRVYGV